MFFHRKNLPPEIETAVQEVDRLLGLEPGVKEIQVTYGLIPGSDREIAMLTRSMLQIMVDLAIQIDVPARHVSEGQTIPSLVQNDRAEEQIGQLIKVHTGTEKPENAFTVVNYEDHWFWIDKRDFKSKRTFAFLMILFSLTETGGQEGLPLVTIPSS